MDDDSRQERMTDRPTRGPIANVDWVKARHRVAYRGAGGPVFNIAIVNSLFSILTLGLYRFWARTRLRRYFWSHVELDGDPIEYTGTGLQLFLGFLIVLALLVPLLFGLQYVAGLFPEEAWQQGVIALVQGLVFLFLIQFAVFRARRYRLGHTRWRGIRAGQGGSAQHYALRAFGYLMLSFLTLGLAHPLFRVRTQRYLVAHTRLGDQPFAFKGRAGPLFKKWLVVWIVAALSFGLLFLGIIPETATFADGDAEGPLLPSGGPLSLVGFAIAGLLYVWYRAREFRYFTDVTRFGPLGFASELKARSLLKIYGIYYLILAVVLAVLVAVMGGLVAGLGQELFAEAEGASLEEIFAQMNPVLVLIPLLALIFATALLSTLQPVLIGHPLLRHAVGTLKLRGQYDVERLKQSGEAADRRGEGLADAFDVDGF